MLHNTLTGNWQYFLSNRENLPLPIHINLSKELSTIALLSFIFWNVYEISNVLKKIERHRSSISEVIGSETGAYLNASQGFFLKILWQ